jgi:hypothetical protein
VGGVEVTTMLHLPLPPPSMCGPDVSWGEGGGGSFHLSLYREDPNIWNIYMDARDIFRLAQPGPDH